MASLDQRISRMEAALDVGNPLANWTNEELMREIRRLRDVVAAEDPNHPFVIWADEEIAMEAIAQANYPNGFGASRRPADPN